MEWQLCMACKSNFIDWYFFQMRLKLGDRLGALKTKTLTKAHNEETYRYVHCSVFTCAMYICQTILHERYNEGVQSQEKFNQQRRLNDFPRITERVYWKNLGSFRTEGELLRSTQRLWTDVVQGPNLLFRLLEGNKYDLGGPIILRVLQFTTNDNTMPW